MYQLEKPLSFRGECCSPLARSHCAQEKASGPLCCSVFCRRLPEEMESVVLSFLTATTAFRAHTPLIPIFTLFYDEC